RLKKLEIHGMIVRDSSKNRSIKIVDVEDSVPEYNEDKYLDVPVYGKVTAGIPITAVEDITETFPLPMSFAQNKDLFMLRVSGDSMINAAILDGDYIIVREQSSAQNGDIVVALIDNEEATVKTFYRENEYIRLQPENDAYEPIISKNVKILGKVAGVFRKM
ncbi:MAG: transcriptional repressor LexA, partial [Clostridia bacterium]|nr:transcriptional repressor LexA [Clostridia bacterium]